MNRLFTYITLLGVATLMACSDDDFAGGNGGGEETMGNTVSMISSRDFEYGGGDADLPHSKSSLWYKYDTKTMEFAWEESDKFVVFAVSNENNPDKDQAVVFEVDPEVEFTSNGKKIEANIRPVEKDVTPIEANMRYVSFMPYIDRTQTKNMFPFDKIPVNFAGQRQQDNVSVGNYWKFIDNNTNEDAKKEYLESEKKAALHLSDYDYRTSAVVSTMASHIHLDFESINAIVRFWMKVPEAVVYDSVQVVTNKSEFLLNATLNAETAEVTPNYKSHVQSLAFGKEIKQTDDGAEKVIGYEGFDLGMSGGGNPKHPEYYDGKTGYVVGYMVLAPIDLTGKDESTFLYLCGHQDITKEEYEKITDEAYKAQFTPLETAPETYRIKKVYKSTSQMTKLNFEKAKVYRWSPKYEQDKPIEFEAISVQEWVKGTTFSNGEEGNGTGGW